MGSFRSGALVMTMGWLVGLCDGRKVKAAKREGGSFSPLGGNVSSGCLEEISALAKPICFAVSFSFARSINTDRVNVQSSVKCSE